MNLALALYEEGVDQSSAPPTHRVHAAITAASLLRDGDFARSCAILKQAVHLLPSTSPRTLNRSDQQHSLSTFTGFASIAAAHSLQSGEDAFEALQLLEIGRGVMASMQLDVRSDISVLEASHPALAIEFKQLRNDIDSPSPIGSDALELTFMSSSRRYALSKDFEILLTKIRSLDGFERFSLGPTKSELMTIAAPGPIVVFNVSEIRSDVILVTSTTITSLSLSALKFEELGLKVLSFKNAVDNAVLNHYFTSKTEVKRLLEWLWDVAVGPVLDELGFTQSPERQRWPRVWWVGGGWLSVLPIHAAGYHGTPKNVLARVISSYTPTIKALVYAREKAVKVVDYMKPQETTLVSMPKAQGLEDLPNVENEIRELCELILNTIILQMPNRAAAVQQILRWQIMHFSCHGISSSSNPSDSQLILNDWKTNPFSVADMIAMNLENS